MADTELLWQLDEAKATRSDFPGAPRVSDWAGCAPGHPVQRIGGMELPCATCRATAGRTILAWRRTDKRPVTLLAKECVHGARRVLLWTEA